MVPYTTSRYWPGTTGLQTAPIPYGNCSCTWTVCQCLTRYQGGWGSAWTTPISSFWEQPKLTAREIHKRRMDQLITQQRRVKDPKIKLSNPKPRPSVQALSIRIR